MNTTSMSLARRRAALARGTGRTVSTTLLGLVFGTFAATIAAHPTPQPHWCSVTDTRMTPPSVVVVGHFDFTGSQMRVLADDFAYQPGSCGQVDHPDAWLCARQIVEAYCRSLSETQALHQVALPVIAGPSTAVRDDHHQTYQLASGLYGACVVCADADHDPTATGTE